MAVNPDPKPGRWILPLVVLGMVAFTYFFVRALPEGTEDDPTDTTVTTPGATFPGGEGTGDTTPEATPPEGGDLDPETQAYLDGVAALQSELDALDQEMTAINEGFDADPREVEFGDAEDRMEVLVADAAALVNDIDALTVPEDLTSNHETIRTAITTAAGAAEDALAGLRSEDDGSQRRDARTAFSSAVDDLRTAVENARSAAGLASSPTTTQGDTTETTAAPDTTEDTAGDA